LKNDGTINSIQLSLIPVIYFFMIRTNSAKKNFESTSKSRIKSSLKVDFMESLSLQEMGNETMSGKKSILSRSAIVSSLLLKNNFRRNTIFRIKYFAIDTKANCSY
jgi:hypothetical protein